jgi:hypothetical protein
LAKEAPDAVVYAISLRNRPAATFEQALRALDTDNDEARVGKREVYWLRRARSKASEVFGIKIGNLLVAEATVRNMNTVQRIVEKYR